MLTISDSKVHEHGIFATTNFKKDDTIELCPYLVIDKEDMGEDCILHDYVFRCPEEDCEDYLVVLGLGMVYNHSFSPNAEWEIYEKDGRFVRFFALKDIKKGEEIFHDYGEEYWDTREEKVK